MALAALMVGCAAAAAPPKLEQQFTANSSDATYIDDKLIEKHFFEFHFDVPGQRWRITNVYASGDNVTQIYHLNESKSWYIKTDVKTGAITMCHLLPVPPGVVQPPVAIDPSALDLGPTPTSSEPEERWEAHLTTPSVATAVYDVQAHAAPGRDPMLMRQNTSAYHTVCPRGPGKGKVPCFLSEVRDNSLGLVVGPPAEWAFNPPQNCSGVKQDEHGGTRVVARPLTSQSSTPPIWASAVTALEKMDVKKPDAMGTRAQVQHQVLVAMCPCAGAAQNQQWNISTLTAASFVTSPLASSCGNASNMAVFSDHDPKHPVEGNAVAMWYGVRPRGQLQDQAQWIVKPETKQLMWASPETGGRKMGDALCLTAFPASEQADPHGQKAGDPLGVWPCSAGNSTKFPNWQTFVPVLDGGVGTYSLQAVGGLCVTWVAEGGTC